MSAQPQEPPRWVTHAVIPLVNLAVALILSGIVIAIIGENPFKAMEYLVYGAVGYAEGIGYTLHYATNFMFTGLAVAVAFHCGLFNIGGEGQAYVAGLGVSLVALYLGGLPFPVVLVLCIVAAALFGGAWAFIPAYLQARRGSHIVITTIMFNFIAASLMTYMLVEVLNEPGNQSPESRQFDSNTWIPYVHDILGWVGIEAGRSPLNLTFIFALMCSVFVWVLIWRTRWGYEIRLVGHNEKAAVYAGVSPGRNIIIAMCISGALAGFVSINELIGAQHRLALDFTAGYGFVGIAVALMGRSHPVGIFLAAILFGMLYQGGTELSFEMPNVTSNMVVVIQGLVILFSGALDNLFRDRILALVTRRRAISGPEPST